MATGRPGACLSTLGPGSTAVLNGVASATLDRVPMLAISGQIESSREQFFTHQLVDHDRLFAPVTKLALRLDPASADTVIRKALRTAVGRAPRRRPPDRDRRCARRSTAAGWRRDRAAARPCPR